MKKMKKMKKTLTLASLILAPVLFLALTSAHADIVCVTETAKDGPVKLTIADRHSDGSSFPTALRSFSSATVSAGPSTSQVKVAKLQSTWDGHLVGMITGKGLSFTYENHYGCIRNATLTVVVPDFTLETINFKQCRGGTTSDDICF